MIILQTYNQNYQFKNNTTLLDVFQYQDKISHKDNSNILPKSQAVLKETLSDYEMTISSGDKILQSIEDVHALIKKLHEQFLIQEKKKIIMNIELSHILSSNYIVGTNREMISDFQDKGTSSDVLNIVIRINRVLLKIHAPPLRLTELSIFIRYSLIREYRLTP